MISYTNNINNLMFGVESVLEDEFGFPVLVGEDHTGNESIIINPESDELIDHFAGGHARRLALNLSYQMVQPMFRNYDQLFKRIERIKRLLTEEINYRVDEYNLSERIIDEDTFSSVSDTFSTYSKKFGRSVTYKWHDGQVINVNFEREDDNFLAQLIFAVTVLEIL